MTAHAGSAGGAASSPSDPSTLTGAPRAASRDGGAGGRLQFLITLVFAALVLATIGGVFLAQRLKHAPTAAQDFRVASSFDPARPGVAGIEQISFKTAHGGLLSVTVIDTAGATVATLARNLRWPAYHTLCLAWNGRRGAARPRIVDGALLTGPLGRCREAPLVVQPTGKIAPAGEYRVRVDVRGHGPAVLSPSWFTLTAGAP